MQQTNCHPFRHGRWLFVHNGFIDGYARLRRDLLLAVDPELFDEIEGTTDSELLFYLALTFGLEDEPLPALERMAGFVEATGRRARRRRAAADDGGRERRRAAVRGPLRERADVANSLYVSNDARDVRAAVSRRRAARSTCRTRRARSSPSRSAICPGCGARCRRRRR